MKKNKYDTFPFVHCHILGRDKGFIKSTRDLHSFGCFTAIDIFNKSREHQQDMPSMFIIPFQRKNISSRFKMFVEFGVKADMVVDENPNARLGILHLVCAFTSQESKDMVGKTVSRMLTDTNAKGYTFISESWVVEQKKPYNYKKDGMPSDHPDKKEKLIVITSDPRQNIMTMKDIRKNKLGKGIYRKTKAQNSMGRFSNLFNYEKQMATVH